jgi:hypothetical protein
VARRTMLVTGVVHMRSRLLELYRRQGVLSVEGGNVNDHPLHSSCPSANCCWGSRAVNDGSRWWNRIQLAYVGPLYEVSPARLLVVGLNLNEDGRLPELEWLVRYAQVALARGEKRIDFGNPSYAGTLLGRNDSPDPQNHRDDVSRGRTGSGWSRWTGRGWGWGRRGTRCELRLSRCQKISARVGLGELSASCKRIRDFRGSSSRVWCATMVRRASRLASS